MTINRITAVRYINPLDEAESVGELRGRKAGFIEGVIVGAVLGAVVTVLVFAYMLLP